MKARIIQIGKFRGVRLPKSLLDQTNLTDDVQIEAQSGQIVIRSARAPRADWEVWFSRMAQRIDDQLLDQPMSTFFDDEE
jgi:antitoxin MazE